jgi:lysozyme family protein
VTTIAEARSALVEATNVLVRRRPAASSQEKQAIDDAIEDINIKIGFLDQAGLLQAAVSVSDAANELQAIVASARLGPFDDTVKALAGAAQKLFDLQGQIRALEALPPAVAPNSPPAAATAPAMAAAAPVGAFKPSASTNFAALQQEYRSFYDACTPRLEFRGQIAFFVNHLAKFRSRYEAVGQGLGIPWQFIGIIHGLEGSFNFGTHLHNGDPLTARTVNAPAGMPKTGNPPFSWEDSARDALIHEGFGGQSDWSVPQMLFRWESYNGMGYRPFGVPSPYLWSFSDIYDTGKYVADGRFDPNAVSKQCGAAVMLKALG